MPAAAAAAVDKNAEAAEELVDYEEEEVAEAEAAKGKVRDDPAGRSDGDVSVDAVGNFFLFNAIICDMHGMVVGCSAVAVFLFYLTCEFQRIV
jgi:hypothetical protein